MGQKAAVRYFYPLSKTIKKSISEKFSSGWRISGLRTTRRKSDDGRTSRRNWAEKMWYPRTSGQNLFHAFNMETDLISMAPVDRISSLSCCILDTSSHGDDEVRYSDNNPKNLVYLSSEHAPALALSTVNLSGRGIIITGGYTICMCQKVSNNLTFLFYFLQYADLFFKRQTRLHPGEQSEHDQPCLLKYLNILCIVMADEWIYECFVFENLEVLKSSLMIFKFILLNRTYFNSTTGNNIA